MPLVPVAVGVGVLWGGELVVLAQKRTMDLVGDSVRGLQVNNSGDKGCAQKKGSAKNLMFHLYRNSPEV